MIWKVGDWAVYERSVVQIKELREGDSITFSDSFIESSGNLLPYLRPLTLKNKRIAETFEIYYNRVREIDGEGGFNWPDISRYFSHLALLAMDAEDKDGKRYCDLAIEFILAAKNYSPLIQGVRLFRRSA